MSDIIFFFIWLVFLSLLYLIIHGHTHTHKYGIKPGTALLVIIVGKKMKK
jgi:hypothetical protein